ncbi:hypothetical protein V9T40_008207 [Parthenolecanium corni]|uniref:DUF1907 domain-containing protein n=1 Tax=Parthenolecanium corni TaxID=536013 RepID=A0AAN9U1Q2_9HEMI
MATDPLDITKLSVEKKTLDTPNLEEVAKVLNSKLCDNFKEVCAEVVDCPDLTQAPFHLAAKGFGGNESIIEVGGHAFVQPLAQRDKIYDLRDFPKVVGDDKSFVIAAGAGPWPFVKTCCEYIVNVIVDAKKVITPLSRIIKTDAGKVKLIITPSEESRYCLLLNAYTSRGESGKVIKVHCKKRTGKLDFISTIREAILAAFPDKVFGFGGVFVIAKGKAKFHVMQDFSSTPLNTDEELNNWLQFYEMLAPLSVVGTFVTKDPGLGLRVQHFHGFSQTEGGHYHYDTTPDDVEYLAYFSPGKVLYRIDRPAEHIGFGAD